MRVTITGEELWPQDSGFSSNCVFQVYLSNQSCDENEEKLHDAMLSWLYYENETSITIPVQLSSALDTLIDLHRMLDGALDDRVQPFVAAMRAELIDMVRRIDSLQFRRAPDTGY